MSKPSKQEIDIFNHLSNEEFHLISHLFEPQFYSKNEFIIQENQKVEHVYFIQSGLVKLSYFDEDLKESILSFAFENWWETDFTAFYNKTNSTLSLQCLENTKVYSIHHANYLDICEHHPKIALYFLDKSIKGHLASQKRILSLLTLNPKNRYEHFLKLYPSLVQRIPKSILAQYLGVSRETLSRLYK